ncbi:hypothetical protein K2Z84_34420 [Candidatus Binatia bacterium]|nr:hypothetical protein [Microbacteriaceae bacterium]MBY0280458.1 hypothetical protein [Candidatus Binatia bacterium]
MTEQYLTRRQLAERFGMTEDAIRGLVRRRHLREGVHFHKPTPHILRFRWSACERWLTTRPAPEPEPAQQHLSEEELSEDLKAYAAEVLGRVARP